MQRGARDLVGQFSHSVFAPQIRASGVSGPGFSLGWTTHQAQPGRDAWPSATEAGSG